MTRTTSPRSGHMPALLLALVPRHWHPALRDDAAREKTDQWQHESPFREILEQAREMKKRDAGQKSYGKVISQ